MDQDNPSTDNAPQNETPVPQEQDSTQQIVNEESSQSEVVSEPSEETQSIPDEIDDEIEDEEEYTRRVQTPTVQPPQFDLSNIPQLDDGTLDANALAEAFNEYGKQIAQTATQQAAQLVQEMEDVRQEERAWQKAMDKYPELKKDRQLAEEVQALRYGLFTSAIQSGQESARMLTPTQAYSRLSKRIGTAKAEGLKQATESVKVQESVYAEPINNASSSDTSTEDKLFKQMRNHDRSVAESAAQEILRKRLFGN